MAHQVMHAAPQGGARSVVAAAVVDHQHFYLVDARNPPREGGERFRQVIGLIEARNLDNEFSHHAPLRLGAKDTSNRLGVKRAAECAPSGHAYADRP
jgi:hypothetical protein